LSSEAGGMLGGMAGVSPGYLIDGEDARRLMADEIGPPAEGVEFNVTFE